MNRYSVKTALLAISIFTVFFAGKIPSRRICNKQYKFCISVPVGMSEIRDSISYDSGPLFFDTAAGVVLMISARDSKFRSVNDYINCSTEQLEEKLRTDYEDSTLKVISCNRSPYYPDKVTVLHFTVSVLPFRYNTYMMYFIHHRHKDIQISFTYKGADEKKNQEYIDVIMKTLKLKGI